MSNTNCSWKQPTPVDIRTNENIDTLSRMLFLDILNGCQNRPYHKVYYHGNKRIDLELQRGQYLLNIAKYQRDLGIPRKRIEKSLEIISKWYNEMIIERKPFGCVITLKNYDELVEMKNETTNEVKSKLKRNENEVKSKNKSVYIEKTEQTDKICIKAHKEKKDFKWLLDNKEKLELKYHYDVQKVIDYVESRGKHNFYKDYEAVVRAWSSKEKAEPKKIGQKEHGNERDPSIYNF